MNTLPPSLPRLSPRLSPPSRLSPPLTSLTPSPLLRIPPVSLLPLPPPRINALVSPRNADNRFHIVSNYCSLAAT